MRRWEYKIIDTKDVPGGGIFKGKKLADVEDYLNKLGEQGWEIINIDALEQQTHHLSFLGVAKRERQ